MERWCLFLTYSQILVTITISVFLMLLIKLLNQWKVNSGHRQSTITVESLKQVTEIDNDALYYFYEASHREKQTSSLFTNSFFLPLITTEKFIQDTTSYGSYISNAVLPKIVLLKIIYLIVSSTSSIVFNASNETEIINSTMDSTTAGHNATTWALLGISLISLIFPLLILIIISAVSCVCCLKLRRATRHRECGEGQRRYELSSTINILNMEENNAYGQIELAQRCHSYCN